MIPNGKARNAGIQIETEIPGGGLMWPRNGDLSAGLNGGLAQVQSAGPIDRIMQRLTGKRNQKDGNKNSVLHDELDVARAGAGVGTGFSPPTTRA